MACRQQVPTLFDVAPVTQSTVVDCVQPHVFCLLQQAPCHHVRKYSDELSIFATSCKVLGSQVLEILGLWILDITELYRQLMWDLEDSIVYPCHTITARSWHWGMEVLWCWWKDYKFASCGQHSGWCLAGDICWLGLVPHQGGEIEERHHVFELGLSNTQIVSVIKKRWTGRL